jgi:hypothetical protein
MCDGRRDLSDAEALRALLFETCGECGGKGETFKPLGTMAHSEVSPHYLTLAEGFWTGERLPPGRYRVGDDEDVWITFELRGDDNVLTNAIYLPEVEHWPFGQTPLSIMWTCPSCGGSGETPRDGVVSAEVTTPSTPDIGSHGEPIQPYPWLSADGGRIEPTRCTLRDGTYWVFPASMLEGETDE